MKVLTGASLSFTEFIYPFWQMPILSGLSGHEDAWRRDTVQSCPKQRHTPFRGRMHRSGGLQAASGQEVFVSLLLNTFLH